MGNNELYLAIIKSCQKRHLSLSLEYVGEEEDVEVEGLPNAPFFAIYWKTDEDEIHCTSLYEFPEEAPDHRLVNERLKETPFTEVKANDAEFMLELTCHLKKAEVTQETLDSLFEKLSQKDGFLKELQSLSLKRGMPLSAEDSSYEKVRDYFQTNGDGRIRVIRRVLNMSMRSIKNCVDRLLKEGLIIPDEDYEYVLSR